MPLNKSGDHSNKKSEQSPVNYWSCNFLLDGNVRWSTQGEIKHCNATANSTVSQAAQQTGAWGTTRGHRVGAQGTHSFLAAQGGPPAPPTNRAFGPDQLLFLGVETRRYRDSGFVRVYVTYSQDSKLNYLQRPKYLYLVCTAIMILQPLTPCSCSHGGQLAYKFNEII